MQVPVYNTGGEIVRISKSAIVFGVPVNEAVVHQALVKTESRRPAGTAIPKDGAKSPAAQKMFAQKHTGKPGPETDGHPRAARWRGFRTASPDYTKAMPKKMRRLALRCVLSSKS